MSLPVRIGFRQFYRIKSCPIVIISPVLSRHCPLCSTVLNIIDDYLLSDVIAGIHRSFIRHLHLHHITALQGNGEQFLSEEWLQADKRPVGGSELSGSDLRDIIFGQFCGILDLCPQRVDDGAGSGIFAYTYRFEQALVGEGYVFNIAHEHRKLISLCGRIIFHDLQDLQKVPQALYGAAADVIDQSLSVYIVVEIYGVFQNKFAESFCNKFKSGHHLKTGLFINRSDCGYLDFLRLFPLMQVIEVEVMSTLNIFWKVNRNLEAVLILLRIDIVQADVKHLVLGFRYSYSSARSRGVRTGFLCGSIFTGISRMAVRCIGRRACRGSSRFICRSLCRSLFFYLGLNGGYRVLSFNNCRIRFRLFRQIAPIHRTDRDEFPAFNLFQAGVLHVGLCFGFCFCFGLITQTRSQTCKRCILFRSGLRIHMNADMLIFVISKMDRDILSAACSRKRVLRGGFLRTERSRRSAQHHKCR